MLEIADQHFSPGWAIKPFSIFEALHNCTLGCRSMASGHSVRVGKVRNSKLESKWLEAQAQGYDSTLQNLVEKNMGGRMSLMESCTSY